MDPIDRALTEAWARVAPRVRADRLEALRRAMRRTGALLSRPIRPWCLCLRASDRRLNVHAWVPKYLPEQHEPHQIAIFSNTIRELCKPVTIPWPGWDLERAASALGRDWAVVHRWMKHGVFRARHVAASIMSKQGKPVPVVWSPTALDPSANLGQAPDPVWGSLWQYLWQRVPDDLEFLVERVPVAIRQPRDGRAHHIGWQFLCPGLPSPSLSTCGRRVDRLYFPLRPWTMLDALDLDDPLDFTFRIPSPGLSTHDPSRRVAVATPRTQDSPTLRPVANRQSPAAFYPACRHCHKIRGFSLTSSAGWNVFVSHLSAGLLLGREVPRPGCVFRRRKAYRARRPRPAPQRERVLNLLLDGLTARQIGQRLGISTGVVKLKIARIYRQHAVHRRAELFAKLGVSHPMPRRRAEVLRGLMAGLSVNQIARGMGILPVSVHNHCLRLYRQHAVHSRAALVARVLGQRLGERLRDGRRNVESRATEPFPSRGSGQPERLLDPARGQPRSGASQ